MNVPVVPFDFLRFVSVDAVVDALAGLDPADAAVVLSLTTTDLGATLVGALANAEQVCAALTEMEDPAPERALELERQLELTLRPFL